MPHLFALGALFSALLITSSPCLAQKKPARSPAQASQPAGTQSQEKAPEPTAFPQPTPPAAKPKAKNYVSVKFGTVKSNYLQMHAQFKNDDGQTREIEFFWANFELAKFLGGIKLNSENKVEGFALGFMLNNDDLISINSYNTDDELLKDDLWTGFTKTFGRVNAKTTEYSYLKTLSDSTFASLTYGISNYPTTITVSKEAFGGDERYFADPRPEYQYLFLGLDIDPVRFALIHSLRLSDQYLASELFYGKVRFGLGLLETTLSNTQHSTTADNSTNQFGLKNASATEIYTPLYFELGIHKTFQALGNTGIGLLGVYTNSPNAISSIYKYNETSTGYRWSASGPIQYGALARFALTF